VYLAAEEDKTIYTFQAEESTAAPTISVLGEAEDDVSGLAMYFGSESEYLFVAQTDVLAVYSPSFELLGSVKFTGPEDLEIAALSIYQRSSTRYPSGVLAYALESDDGEMFGVSSLAPLFETLDLDPNTTYTPRSGRSSGGPRKTGFELRDGSLACFAGWKGRYCSEVTCPKSCSGHGRCVGPNQCRCDASWAGPDCSFALVRPKYETDPNGEDGDDPAIWISPVSPGASRIITTTKSEEGAGLAVFDLTGKMLQTVSAGEPNNVDVIYGFKAGNRTVDLAFAACRDDNTLW
jgi:3-phytase